MEPALCHKVFLDFFPVGLSNTPHLIRTEKEKFRFVQMDNLIRSEKRSCPSKKCISLGGFRNISAYGLWGSRAYGLSILTNGGHSRPEKRSCRFEKYISLVALRNILTDSLWVSRGYGLSIRTNHTNGERHSRAAHFKNEEY